MPYTDKINWHRIAIIVHRDNIARIPRIVARTNVTVSLRHSLIGSQFENPHTVAC